MEQDFHDIIRERMAKLPPALLAAFKDINLLGRVRSIITKYGLRVDDGGAFEDEVMLVLLGMEHPDNFVKNLVKVLHVELDVVEKLVLDVESSVFLPVRESLMKMFPAHNHENSSVSGQQKSATGTTPKNGDISSTKPTTSFGPTPNTTKNIAQTKLESTVHVPASSVTVKETAQNIPQKPIDPYREPIE